MSYSADASPSPAPADTHGFQTVAPLPGRLAHEIDHTGYLESWTLGIVLVVIAALIAMALGFTGYLRRRRGRRLVPRLPRAVVNVAAGVTSFVVLMAGVTVLVNAYAGYVPTISALFGPTGATRFTPRVILHGTDDARRSRVVRVDIAGAAYGMHTEPAYVYLPPGYDQPANAETRYPTVYLIHGFPGRAADWFTAGQLKHTMDLLLAHHLVRPMIVVSPTASTGYFNDDECLNSAIGHPRVEDYLTFGVVAAIDRSFRTIPDRSHRALGGMSSGGYCALDIGLHHLHRFGVLLASEPYGDPGYNAYARMLHHDNALLKVDSPKWLIPRVRFDEPVSVFLDAGSKDLETQGETYAMARALADRHQLVAYRAVGDVGHTWREAQRALPYALIFASQQFGHVRLGGSDAIDAAEVQRLLTLAFREAAPVAMSPSPSPSPSGSVPSASASVPATGSPSPSPSRSSSRRPAPRRT